MKVISDQDLKSLAKNKSIKPLGAKTTEKPDHPYVQHMAKLEQLMQGMAASKETTDTALKIATDMVMASLGEIADLQEKLNALMGRLILDNNNEVWIATVQQRDHSRLLKEVEFKKITKGNA